MNMTDPQRALIELAKEDERYELDAYLFVREALSYAQGVLRMGDDKKAEDVASILDMGKEAEHEEQHLTGQQLCEAIRRYGLEQYGYLAQVVLNRWGVTTTGDFGEIVYGMIHIGLMKKSTSDRREDFDNVYDFDEGFRKSFDISMPD